MKKLTDSVFGTISYDVLWRRGYQAPFLRKEREVVLVITGDDDADFEIAQYEAFTEFEANRLTIVEAVEEALFKYYFSICTENREKFGSQADELSPVISKREELEDLVSLKQIIVMESFDTESREIGFVLDAIWNPELGVGIKVVNGKVEAVGTQDIVL